MLSRDLAIDIDIGIRCVWMYRIDDLTIGLRNLGHEHPASVLTGGYSVSRCIEGMKTT
jgi:hypothetical protein